MDLSERLQAALAASYRIERELGGITAAMAAGMLDAGPQPYTWV